MGVGASAALHIAILTGLLLNPVGRSFGAPGYDLGTGMAVSLVAGFSAGGPMVVPDPAEPPEPETGDAEQQREVAAPIGASGEGNEETREPEAEDARRQVPRLAMMRMDASGEAANEFQGLTGATAALGGDPTATSDLLAQISRCLPPDFRPSLAFTQLVLSIGPDGRLAAAPNVTSALPLVEPASRRIADRIVQAALLCGPYSHPDAVGRVMTLPADFSAVPENRADQSQDKLVAGLTAWVQSLARTGSR